MQSDKSVEDFYNSFLESRMVRYRLRNNLRLDLAKELLLSVVRSNDTVADIGCGIGIITEALAKANPRARIIGVDISSANINYARNTIKRSGVEFINADVVEQFDHLHEFSPMGYDVLALVDVIEHIPARHRPELFADLERLAKPSSLLVLTYPTPEYQRYLIAKSPNELQVIDNIIELDELSREAGASGWSVQSFRKVDVWLRNQYVHCILARTVDMIDTEPAKISSVSRMWKLVSDAICYPYRAWYYRDRLMRRGGTDGSDS